MELTAKFYPWEYLTESPVGWHRVIDSARYNNKIFYAFGGYRVNGGTISERLTCLWSFDTDSGSWENIELPFTVSAPNQAIVDVTVVGNKLYMLSNISVFRYDCLNLLDGSWQQLEYRLGANSFGSFVHQEMIYYFISHSPDERGTCNIYDTNTNIWLTDIKCGVHSSASVTIIEDKAYSWVCKDRTKLYLKIYEYSGKNKFQWMEDIWTSLWGAQATPRTVTFGTDIYTIVSTGEGSQSIILDTNTNELAFDQPVFRNMQGCQATLIGEKIYVFKGAWSSGDMNGEIYEPGKIYTVSYSGSSSPSGKMYMLVEIPKNFNLSAAEQKSDILTAPIQFASNLLL